MKVIWYVANLGNDISSYMLYRNYFEELKKINSPCFCSENNKGFIRFFLNTNDILLPNIIQQSKFRPKLLRWRKIEVDLNKNIENYDSILSSMRGIEKIILTSRINVIDCISVLCDIYQGNLSISS
jgi:hypothetical protein